MGISFEDELSGKTTCTGTLLKCENATPALWLNIRYAITQDIGKMELSLAGSAASMRFSYVTSHNSRPNYFPKEHPAVKLLTEYFNQETGLSKEPFVMGGGTYARKLPNAFAYGLSGIPDTEEDLENRKKVYGEETGRGGAHQPDEGLNIRKYFAALKLLAGAIVELDRELG